MTGGAGSIGSQAALVFARECAQVMVANLSAKGAKEAAKLIIKVGDPATRIVVDVSDPAGVSRP